MTAQQLRPAGQLPGPRHPVTNRAPYVTVDAAGRETAHVPLSGRRGVGLEALVDAADWRWIEPLFGSKWVRTVSKRDQHGRVVSGTSQALAGAKRIGLEVSKCSSPLVALVRVIEQAARGGNVFRINGDPLDLRRANLEHVAPADLALWTAELAVRPA